MLVLYSINSHGLWVLLASNGTEHQAEMGLATRGGGHPSTNRAPPYRGTSPIPRPYLAHTSPMTRTFFFTPTRPGGQDKFRNMTKISCSRRLHPGGNPGANLKSISRGNRWFFKSTPIQMPPESGGICGICPWVASRVCDGEVGYRKNLRHNGPVPSQARGCPQD